jgi:hypothetical protein
MIQTCLDMRMYCYGWRSCTLVMDSSRQGGIDDVCYPWGCVEIIRRVRPVVQGGHGLRSSSLYVVLAGVPLLGRHSECWS